MVKYSWYKYYYIIVIVSYQICVCMFSGKTMKALLSIMLNKQVNMIMSNKKGTKNRSDQEVMYV